jgi:SAM-dependent methyltransferase
MVNALKANRHIYQAARTARMSFGSLVGGRQLPGIPGRVHFNDFMLQSGEPADIEIYMRCSREVIGQLEDAIAVAGKKWKDLRSVLEFGCGYGRITRLLVQKVEPARVTVCDVIGEGARFCAKEFHVRAVHSTAEISDFHAEPSDLVFFISVQTHLSERRLLALQAKLQSLLKPGGILFFTTMGWASALQTERYGARWVAESSRIADELRERGFSFHPYGYYKDPDYGMAWETFEHTAGLIRRLHGDSLRLLQFSEGASDGHQDVYVYQRVA